MNNLYVKDAHIRNDCKIRGNLTTSNINCKGTISCDIIEPVKIRVIGDLTCNNLDCNTINQNKFCEINCQICESKSVGFGWKDNRFLEKEGEGEDEGIDRFRKESKNDVEPRHTTFINFLKLRIFGYIMYFWFLTRNLRIG